MKSYVPAETHQDFICKNRFRMKKNLRLLFVCLCALPALSGWAQDYRYLTIQTTDGTESSHALDGLVLTFDAGNLLAARGGSQTTYAVSTLDKMFLSSAPTAIRSAETGRTAVSLDRATLTIKAPAGTQARVFDSTGRMVMSTRIGTNGTAMSLGNLTPGIYIVKAGNQTSKILVK